jgi:Domain of unknown function (DUF5666)
MRRLAPPFSMLPIASAVLTVTLSLGLTTAAYAASTSSGSSGGRSFPGASGSVAAITGTSMEVQNQLSGQVTVSWTTSTTFSQMVDVSASSVAVGDCVTVTGSTSKKSKAVSANTVTVSQPTSGTCSGGPGGFAGSGSGGTSAGGGFPGGSSGPPSGGSFPGGGSGRPPSGGRFPGGGSGRPRGVPNFGFASGKVTAVSSGSLTISGFSSASLSAPKKNAKGTRPKIKTSTVKVTVSSSTTYKESQGAASTALAVGDCVTAAGSSDSTGAVTASSVQITSTGRSSCTSGFAGLAGEGSGSA